MNVTPIVGFFAVAVLVMGTRTAAPADGVQKQDNKYMITSRHQTSASPAVSAECVVKNARGSGAPSAEIQPLYGMTQVGVVMRDRPTGDTLAVAVLQPENPGSLVVIGTTPHVTDRDALVSELLKGC